MQYVDDYLYDKPSILLPRKGSLSNIQYADTPFWTVDTLYYTEVDDTKADAYYLYYYLKLLDLSNLDSGTGVPSMTFDSYYNIRVSLPELSEQKRVSTLLHTIDNTISVKRQINDYLEAMARQLYDYWFVQFDFPDENGKPYKSSGGQMIWNDKLKREIPESWKVVNIFEGASVLYGFPFSTESFVEEPTDKPIVRIRDILDGSVSAYTTEVVDEKYRLSKGDVVIGMDGNFHMNIWQDDKAYLNQRCVRIRPNYDSQVSSIQIFYDAKPYIEARERTIKGSTVGHLSDKDMKLLQILVPKRTEQFNPRPVFDNIVDEISRNRIEISDLIKQRDEILPLLMNGQVSVRQLNNHFAEWNRMLSSAFSKLRMYERRINPKNRGGDGWFPLRRTSAAAAKCC